MWIIIFTAKGKKLTTSTIFAGIINKLNFYTMKKTNLNLSELEIAILKIALNDYRQFWREQALKNVELGFSHKDAVNATAIKTIESLQAKLLTND